MNRALKDLHWIKNIYEPANFKEYAYLIDACISDIEILIHKRTKINDQLKELRALKKHLLANPITKDKGDET